ncbi:hypothetical protein HZH68_014987 [Vespula germanica]|uniref:Uncharacterized protein n=1 Tax=Vespula germanica TaxID=30212 RepID=A0A834J7H9_VESGE|nr:hypothetical protein HZH68_014987 [Vespula germanica]
MSLVVVEYSDERQRMSTMDSTHCPTNHGHHIRAICEIFTHYTHCSKNWAFYTVSSHFTKRPLAISRIENYESKENNKDLSSTINTSELIWKIFRLYHLGRLSNFGKLTGVVTSGRSKKTTKTTILEQYRK